MSSIGPATMADLAAQLKAQAAAIVQTFERYTKDVPKEKLSDARYAGDLRPNQNRLNVFSLAPRGDTQDHYRINVKFAGNVHLNMLVDSLDAQRHVVESKTAKGLGIQVIQYQGNSPKVIADSDPESGTAYTRFTQLAGAGARLAAGKYVIRVYREASTPANQEFFYSLQLVGDRYYQDYDTLQREAPAHPPTKSKFETMGPNPAVMLLAQNMDPSMGIAMLASTRPATLTAPAQDDGTSPVVHLLDAFM
jgi:hypothetical protein